MRENYALYTDKLQGEYRDSFHQIEMYMDGKAYRVEAFEDRMMELLDIFLVAQERGKPVRSITGKSLERFCKNFCEECSLRTRLKNVAEALRGIAWCLLALSLVELLFLPEEGWDGSWRGILFATTELPVGSYLIGFLAMFFVIRLFGMVVRAIMFKVRWLSWKLYISVSVTLWVGMTAGLFWFYLNCEIGSLSIPVIPMALASGGYLIACFLYSRKQKGEHGHIKLSQWLSREAAEDARSAGEITLAMQKQFAKRNLRRARRGKAEWTWEEYIRYLERDEERTRRILKSYFVIPVFVAAGFTVLSWSEGESVTAAAIAECFFLVLAVAGVPFLVMYALMRLACKMRWEWIHEQRRMLEEKDGASPSE